MGSFSGVLAGSRRAALTSFEETFANDAHPMRSELAQAAQKVYDSWQQDEDGRSELVGYGGICHLIADEMLYVLDRYNVRAMSQSCSHMVHVNVIAQFREGLYLIDIYPYNYETGGGYTWKKLPDIEFDAGFVTGDLLDRNPFNWREYMEDWDDYAEQEYGGDDDEDENEA